MVDNEGYEDAVLDVINYMILFYGYQFDKKMEKEYKNSLFNCTTRELS
jgi:hypothetical protein